jgi:hypothetical protein
LFTSFNLLLIEENPAVDRTTNQQLLNTDRFMNIYELFNWIRVFLPIRKANTIVYTSIIHQRSVWLLINNHSKLFRHRNWRVSYSYWRKGLSSSIAMITCYSLFIDHIQLDKFILYKIVDHLTSCELIHRWRHSIIQTTFSFCNFKWVDIIL